MSSGVAVIFDMDGVLVDSYEAHYRSWKEVAASLGRAMSPEEFAATFGQTSREIIAWLWPDRAGRDVDIALLDHRKEAAFREILARDFPAMPGARSLLESLHAAGFALGLGSSGPPENVELVLRRLGVQRLFGAVITGMDVTRGKPDPEVFLLAAQRLGVAPSQCAVVEDAPLGIAAAKAAGMASVGLVSTGRTRDALAQADLVVDRLDQLSPEVFHRLIASHQAKGSRP